jgi:hypothetical protein
MREKETMKIKMTKTQRRVANFFRRAGRGEVVGSIEQFVLLGRPIGYFKDLMADLKRSGQTLHGRSPL